MIEAAPLDDFGLVQACRRLHAVVDEFDALVADRVGIARNDLRCLNLLEHGPVLPKDIAKRLNLTSGSVTTLLDRLEQRNLIKRTAHPKDRRAILIEATPQVFNELGQLYRQMGEAVVQLSHDYGANQATQAAKHLSDLSDQFEKVMAQL